MQGLGNGVYTQPGMSTFNVALSPLAQRGPILAFLRHTVTDARNIIALPLLTPVSSALCVDCISVGLTVIGLRRFDPKSSFATVLFRQGLSFFLLVLPFQTFVTVSWT